METFINLSVLIFLLLIALAWRAYSNWWDNTETTYWYSRHACKFCLKFLSEHQRMYSNGICPHCGRRGKGAVTIVSSKQISIRETTKRYRFKETVTYEGRDELAVNVLRKNNYSVVETQHA